MIKTNKDAFFIEKFNRFIFVTALVTFIIACIVVYLSTNFISQRTIQKKILTEFSGVNEKIISQESMNIRPITAGILSEKELVVVYRGEKIEFSTPIPDGKDKLKEITLLVSKNENDKRAVRIKLYIDMKERVKSYYLNMYLVIFPMIFAILAFLALIAVKFVRKNTARLYQTIYDLKDFEKLGLEFNQVKQLSGEDEAAIISKEYNKILKELRRAYDKERQFVYDAAHELRVPLVKIEGSVNMLDMKGFSEEGKNMEKENMKNCLREAKTLIDNMFDLTHEVIVVKDRIAGTNIAEVAKDVVDSYKLIYEDFIFNIESIEFSYHIRKADLVKLMNIFIDNGIKYSKEEKKQIDIKLRQEKDKFLLSFHDYGIGMTSEQQQRIFDIFWRADTSRGRDTGGVGMGLTIAKKLCESYDLGISVNSSADHGTTIELIFESANK